MSHALALGKRPTARHVPRDLYYRGDISPAPSADQDDYNPTGFARASVVRLNPSASINVSGLVAQPKGAIKTLINVTTDFMVLLTHEDPSSAAANRLNFGSAIPFYILMPGEAVTFYYDATTARWRFLSGHHGPNLGVQFDVFSDWTEAFSPTNAAAAGPLNAELSGTGASVQVGTFGADATERAIGILQMDTGTTASGRAGIYNGSNTCLAPQQGAALFACRIAVEALSTGSDRFQVFAGFQDMRGAAAPNDGVYFKYDDAASANWRVACKGGGTESVADAGGPLAVGTTYVILGIFVNPGWTRADFFYSSDSIAAVVSGAGTQSGGNMPISTELTNVGISINKTIGLNQRNMDIDWIGWRFANQQR